MWAWISGLGVLLAGGFLTIWLCRLIQVYEAEFAESHLQSVTRAIETQARNSAEQRIQLLIRVAEGLARRPGVSRGEWAGEARLLMEHETGYLLLAVTDPEGVIEWLEAMEDVGLSEQDTLPVDPDYLAEVRDSAGTGVVIVGDTISGLRFLPDGRAAVTLHVPIGTGEEHRGFVVGARTLTGSIDSLLAAFEPTGIDLQVKRQGVTVYQSPPGQELPQSVYRETFQLSAEGREPTWDFVVSLRPEVLAASRLPLVALLIGLSMTLLTALLAVLGLSRYSHGVALKHANVKLREEIIDRRRVQQDLTFLARHDPLTRLPNRVEIMKQAQAKLARHESGVLAVMFLDVDAFKDINDSMGHGTGDALLQCISGRLESVLSPEDRLGRYGGDEFVIVSQRPDTARIELLARSILRAFEDDFPVDGQSFRVTASIGIALHPVAGPDIQTMIQNADVALFEAKREGRNRYALFQPRLLKRVSRRHDLSQDIHRALASSEFHVVYQPIVRLSDLSLCGTEALLRWQRASGEIVRPSEFIPIAERSGAIGELSRLALDLVGNDMSEWRQACPQPPQVSVNISGSRFKQSDFVERLDEMLRRHDFPPDRLQLEITEQVLVENLPRIRSALDRIASLGVKLAIDDFGVGYSSLAYLKNLPVSTVKIDKSFVQDLVHDRHDQFITRVICDLTRELGMEAVAEGVENEQQLRLLYDCGCPKAQGYWFCRPVTAPEIMEMLRGQLPWRAATSAQVQLSQT